MTLLSLDLKLFPGVPYVPVLFTSIMALRSTETRDITRKIRPYIGPKSRLPRVQTDCEICETATMMELFIRI